MQTLPRLFIVGLAIGLGMVMGAIHAEAAEEEAPMGKAGGKTHLRIADRASYRRARSSFLGLRHWSKSRSASIGVRTAFPEKYLKNSGAAFRLRLLSTRQAQNIVIPLLALRGKIVRFPLASQRTESVAGGWGAETRFNRSSIDDL